MAEGPPVEIAVREVVLEHARPSIVWNTLVASPDGRRVAYVTGKGAGVSGAALNLLGMEWGS